jgi:hypothetical protein
LIPVSTSTRVPKSAMTARMQLDTQSPLAGAFGASVAAVFGDAMTAATRTVSPLCNDSGGPNDPVSRREAGDHLDAIAEVPAELDRLEDYLVVGAEQGNLCAAIGIKAVAGMRRLLRFAGICNVTLA